MPNQLMMTMYGPLREGGDEQAGYFALMVDKGEFTHEDLYLQCIHNWYSVEVIERMINLGYMLDYVQQLKDGGWIPNDFVRTPIESASGSSNSNTQITPSTPSYSQEEIDVAWVESKRIEPTCMSDGYIEFKNSLTGNKKKETLPMVEHSYEKTETPSTCAEAGVITYTCSVCADTYTEELPLAEHSYNESEKVDASCTENGKITYMCTVCHTEKEEQLSATGHDTGEWVVVKEAGLFTEGLKELCCTKDAEVLSSEVIPQTSPVSLWVVIGIGVLVVGIVVGVFVYKKRSVK